MTNLVHAQHCFKSLDEAKESDRELNLGPQEFVSFVHQEVSDRSQVYTASTSECY